jgi:hypothetical protein
LIIAFGTIAGRRILEPGKPDVIIQEVDEDETA